MLLQNGANPNDTDTDKWLTPLHCAIYGYHLDRADDTAEFVGELIENGADTRRLDRYLLQVRKSSKCTHCASHHPSKYHVPPTSLQGDK